MSCKGPGGDTREGQDEDQVVPKGPQAVPQLTLFLLMNSSSTRVLTPNSWSISSSSLAWNGKRPVGCSQDHWERKDHPGAPEEPTRGQQKSNARPRSTFLTIYQRFWGAREIPVDLILVSKDIRTNPKHHKIFNPTSASEKTMKNIN